MLGEWVDKVDHLAHWGLQIRARAHGRVKKGFGGKPSLSYDLTNEDVATMKLAMKRLAKAAFAAGARAVLPGVHGVPATLRSPDELTCFDSLADDPRNFHFICAHLFGTMSMGSDRRSSVVDPKGELWDLPGLYVADASVLPTNFGVNPQHTISAVAWLIAEGLLDRVS
jgi:choline dehydrogenase-like flavoprotein